MNKAELIQQIKMVEESDYWGKLTFISSDVTSPRIAKKRIEILSRRMIKGLERKEVK